MKTFLYSLALFAVINITIANARRPTPGLGPRPGPGRGRPGGRPAAFSLFGPPFDGRRRNATFVEVTCDADASPPITCGLPFGNATGIVVCRSRNVRNDGNNTRFGGERTIGTGTGTGTVRGRGRIGKGRRGRGRGRRFSNSTTICIDPEKGREGDTCGCCVDDDDDDEDGDVDDSCPTEPCGCPCDIKDRDGNVIGTGVNVTRVMDNDESPGDRFGSRRRRTSICVSPEDSITFRLSGRLECVPNTAEACPQGGF